MSDTGHHRSVNEDSYVARPPVFAVADGMGGHAAGDFASSAVVTRLAELSAHDGVAPADVESALHDAVGDIERGAPSSERGTGTTVTGIAVAEGEDGDPAWLVFNIGDSRVYRLAEGALDQLTVDHSVVQELIDTGAITPEEALVHPHGNVITRAVGFNEAPRPDFDTVPIAVGDRFLVASDGLTKELTPHGIRHFLGEAGTTREAADALLGAALGNGGRDNVTVVVVEVLAVRTDGEDTAPRRH